MHLEKGLPVSLVSKEVGASKGTVSHWVKAYRERGEAGLRNEVRRSGSRRKLPAPVRKKMAGKKRDVTTAFIFKEILEDEEEHHDLFTTMLEEV
jgi:transposase